MVTYEGYRHGGCTPRYVRIDARSKLLPFLTVGSSLVRCPGVGGNRERTSIPTSLGCDPVWATTKGNNTAMLSHLCYSCSPKDMTLFARLFLARHWQEFYRGPDPKPALLA